MGDAQLVGTYDNTAKKLVRLGLKSAAVLRLF